MILYKYMSIEYAKEAIINGIYAAPLEAFNDPYENIGIRYLDDYRVCCLTKSAQKMLMWAYYGNHRGCCLAFEVPDDVDIIKDVQYTKDYYQHENMNSTELLTSLYTKAYEWQHENEVRIVYFRPTATQSMWNIVDKKIYFKASVKALFFGLKTDFKGPKCQDLMIHIRNNCPNIDIKQCRLSSSSYRIIWDKQFDYTHEII